jgi:large subunit ribosomal protein L7/L12
VPRLAAQPTTVWSEGLVTDPTSQAGRETNPSGSERFVKSFTASTLESVMNVQELSDSIANLSLLEASQLVKSLERRLGVSAQQTQAPVVPSQLSVDEPAEQTEFTVTLKAIGPNKINVIKAVREVTTLGLKEAKDLVDRVPTTVKEAISKAEADVLHKKLADAGATVEIT